MSAAETIPAQLKRWVYLGDVQSPKLNILMIVALDVHVAILLVPAKQDVRFGSRFRQRVCSIITRLCLQADG
jgi:hypothetical protein